MIGKIFIGKLPTNVEKICGYGDEVVIKGKDKLYFYNLVGKIYKDVVCDMEIEKMVVVDEYLVVLSEDGRLYSMVLGGCELEMVANNVKVFKVFKKVYFIWRCGVYRLKITSEGIKKMRICNFEEGITDFCIFENKINLVVKKKVYFGYFDYRKKDSNIFGEASFLENLDVYKIEFCVTGWCVFENQTDLFILSPNCLYSVIKKPEKFYKFFLTKFHIFILSEKVQIYSLLDFKLVRELSLTAFGGNYDNIYECIWLYSNILYEFNINECNNNIYQSLIQNKLFRVAFKCFPIEFKNIFLNYSIYNFDRSIVKNGIKFYVLSGQKINFEQKNIITILRNKKDNTDFYNLKFVFNCKSINVSHRISLKVIIEFLYKRFKLFYKDYDFLGYFFYLIKDVKNFKRLVRHLKKKNLNLNFILRKRYLIKSNTDLHLIAYYYKKTDFLKLLEFYFETKSFKKFCNLLIKKPKYCTRENLYKYISIVVLFKSKRITKIFSDMFNTHVLYYMTKHKDYRNLFFYLKNHFCFSSDTQLVCKIVITAEQSLKFKILKMFWTKKETNDNYFTFYNTLKFLVFKITNIKISDKSNHSIVLKY
ncbi:hypothetical protein CWI37_1244p0010 [Hamiltosporidium tvaerminnensis]|uniref:Uncharacterized protein n=1 Tax=Hamiltosporidium tvaerminnensis TaxID=1176355 RepID=A0A4Q9KZP1_9MICR|nr:hypothetical protein LUQ84_002454 [Hamiltosporidium tvaerminnensis]TBT99709.1 hypothetical protein CWI37_1244p0010 [Hamiltosporidium tvaerminnensis]